MSPLAQMEDIENKEVKNASARVPLALHNAASQKMIKDGQSFQSLIVTAIEKYVRGDVVPLRDAETELALHVLDILREDRDHEVWGLIHDRVIAAAKRRMRGK